MTEQNKRPPADWHPSLAWPPQYTWYVRPGEGYVKALPYKVSEDNDFHDDFHADETAARNAAERYIDADHVYLRGDACDYVAKVEAAAQRLFRRSTSGFSTLREKFCGDMYAYSGDMTNKAMKEYRQTAGTKADQNKYHRDRAATENFTNNCIERVNNAYNQLTKVFEEKREATMQAARLHARGMQKNEVVVIPVDAYSVRRKEFTGDMESDKITFPVWGVRENWYKGRDENERMAYAIVRQNETFISYYANARDLQRGKRTEIKPGRYLTSFYKDALSERRIAFFAAWQATGIRETPYTNETDYPIKFARTPEEIARVYVYGPNSCMSKGKSFFGFKYHPAEVYGAGDLAVAWLECPESKTILARALVWEEKKILGRIYTQGPDSGDVAEAFKNRLLASGMRSIYDGSTFDGARLLAIPLASEDNSWLMPYIDVHNRFSIHPDGNYFVMMKRGGFSAEVTRGVVSLPDICKITSSDPVKYPMPVRQFRCDNCGNKTTAENITPVYCGITVGSFDPTVESPYCPSCVAEYSYVCAGLNHRFSARHVARRDINGTRYSLVYVRANGFRSDRTGSWFLNSDTRVPVLVAEGNFRQWATSEAQEYAFVSAYAGEYVSNQRRNRIYPSYPDWLRTTEIENHMRQSSLSLAA